MPGNNSDSRFVRAQAASFLVFWLVPIILCIVDHVYALSDAVKGVIVVPCFVAALVVVAEVIRAGRALCRWPCPRCGDRFIGWRTMTPGRRCVNCGLFVCQDRD